MAIALGVTVPIAVIVLVAVGLLVVPRVLDNLQATPSSSPSTTPTADPVAVPAVGTCYDAPIWGSTLNHRGEAGKVVPCEEEHTLETIAAGEVPDADEPLDPSSEEAHELYEECEQAALEFLGVPWRSTYTWLVLSVPSPGTWNDGAHWYRCDLAVNDGFYQTFPTRVTGSLRGNARPITCLRWVETEGRRLTEIEPSDCTVEHQGELAGVYPVEDWMHLGDPDTVRSQFSLLCEPVVLSFLEAPRIPDPLAYWFFRPGEDALDQWALCVVAADEANRGLTGSLRGIGSGPIPFA